MSHDIKNSDMIRAMVVDDSAVIRGMITSILQEDEKIKVVTTAADGQIALDNLKNYDIDVIVLDIDMPVMDGITALPKFFEIDPNVEVIVASTLSQKNASISLRALEAGAADYLAKPSNSYELGHREIFKHELTQKVLALGARAHQNRLKTSDKKPTHLLSAENLKTVDKKQEKPLIIAVGSSTGGPQALFDFLSGLKDNVEQPIVITQHMPPTFTKMLAQHITKHSGMPCSEAEDGMVVQNNHVYVAPGDYHMTFVREGTKLIVKLNQENPVNYCRPAVDVMMRSLNQIYRNQVLAVILTGMGNDGEQSCKELHNSGSVILAQDEESSVVWGMPGAVAKAGICSAILPLEELAKDVVRRANS